MVKRSTSIAVVACMLAMFFLKGDSYFDFVTMALTSRRVVANSMNMNPMSHPQIYQQQQAIMAQRQRLLMNGLAAGGISATGGNPGMPQSQQFARSVLPNGMHVGPGHNPQIPGMGGFPGVPGMPRQIPPHMQHVCYPS